MDVPRPLRRFCCRIESSSFLGLWAGYRGACLVRCTNDAYPCDGRITSGQELFRANRDAPNRAIRVQAGLAVGRMRRFRHRESSGMLLPMRPVLSIITRNRTLVTLAR